MCSWNSYMERLRIQEGTWFKHIKWSTIYIYICIYDRQASTFIPGIIISPLNSIDSHCLGPPLNTTSPKTNIGTQNDGVEDVAPMLGIYVKIQGCTPWQQQTHPPKSTQGLHRSFHPNMLEARYHTKPGQRS